MTGYLPHHRRGPRVDERRRDPADLPTVAGIFALVYVVCVVTIVAISLVVIR